MAPLCPLVYGGLQNVSDRGGVKYHVFPRESKHQPAIDREAVVPPGVPREGRTVPVPLEGVRLQDDPEPLVDQIGASEESGPGAE
jgi:hypothetical protein